GHSLVPLFKGNTPEDWRKSFYYHYYEFPGAHSVARHYGVTTGKHKLIHYYHLDTPAWEMFDLEKDPNELNSVYGKPEYADSQKALEAELKRLREHYKVPENDPVPAKRKRQKGNQNQKGKDKAAAAKKKAA
ncbi:MAG: DUF4976 domain-containing protein, partial [Verrucomicrobiales bacterium]|nr:DUF4976 domain-containing protein [Verrucomicrobiales bacterium]